MECGNRRKFIKLLFCFLIFSVVCLAFSCIYSIRNKANTEEVFGFENGAWIKVVDSSKVEPNGDTNAIRFKFKMNKNFIDNNNLSKLNFTATMAGVEFYNQTFNNVDQLVSDGEYTHNFDFANIPFSLFSDEIILTMTALFDDGKSESVSIGRSMEYVYASAFANGELSNTNNYFENCTVFSDDQEKIISTNTVYELYINGYEGENINSVYVNSVKQADCSLIVSKNKESILIDSSILQSDSSSSIMFITENRNVIRFNSILVSNPIEDVVLDEFYLIKSDTNAEINLIKEYNISKVLFDDTTELAYSVENNKLLLSNFSTLPSGKHEIYAYIENQDNKIQIPVFVFDQKFVLTDRASVVNWLTECRVNSNWNEENQKSKKYYYTILENDVDFCNENPDIEIYDKSCVSGVFDGKGHSLSNFDIPLNSLFYRTYDFEMKNIGFVNVRFNDTFLYTGASFSTRLINSYFDVVSTINYFTPFPDGEGIDYLENVVFNLELGYKGETSLFRNSDPKFAKNLFIIGYNDNRGSLENINPLKNSENGVNCDTFGTVAEFISGVDKNLFNEYWDFTRTDHVWKSAPKN